MNKKVQRIIVFVLAAALLLTVMVPVLSFFAQAAVTKDDINNIKSELSEIQEQKKETEKKLAAVRNDLSKSKAERNFFRKLRSRLT